MRTGLSAEMLRLRGYKVGGVPAADAQIAGFFAGDKPMVGLALLRPADVARYNLLDHSRSLPGGRRIACNPSASTVTIPIRSFWHLEIVVANTQ